LTIFYSFNFIPLFTFYNYFNYIYIVYLYKFFLVKIIEINNNFLRIILTKNKNEIIKFLYVNVKWFDSVPGAFGFQAVKLTPEDSRRNQLRLST